MPREIVHWDVLTRAVAALPGEGCPNCQRVLQQYRAAAFLGAMAHDAAYYYRFGKDQFDEIAGVLHGYRGEDTFVPLKKLAKRISEIEKVSERELLWAFLLGMLSHQVTDVIFHPAVYYFTGNYYDLDLKRRHTARARHRLFEVYLDSWFRERNQFWNGSRFNTLLRELGEGFSVITRCLDDTLYLEGEQGEVRGRWRGSFLYMSNLQTVFLSKGTGAAIRGLNFLLRGGLSEVDALFSFGRVEKHKVFANKLVFKNPASGEESSFSVDEMRDKAVLETVQNWRIFEHLVSGALTDVEVAFGDRVGRSLDLGVYRFPSEQAKYFAAEGFPLKGLS